MKKLLLITIAIVFLAIKGFSQTSLPTSWDFSTTTLPADWTSAGGFTYYPAIGNPAPSAKFQATGDILTIFFLSAPGNISYDIVGNAFSGGTFIVEESIDGIAWTTLNTYTTPPTAYTNMSDVPSTLSRYIRFNYSNKVSGNIGLDNVNIDLASATITCFSTPDGIDASGWSYKDYVIPTGYQLDSVYMDALRPGFSTQDFDFVLESCQGTTVYTTGIGTYPFDYSTDNNSEYNIWIDLTFFNYVSVGMVRASLPTNAGAIWNQVCFAVSPQISTEITKLNFTENINLFPNPNNGNFNVNVQSPIEHGEFVIYDCQGKEIFRQNIFQNKNLIESTQLSSGMYFYSVIENKQKIKTGKIIIN